MFLTNDWGKINKDVSIFIGGGEFHSGQRWLISPFYPTKGMFTYLLKNLSIFYSSNPASDRCEAKQETEPGSRSTGGGGSSSTGQII